MHKIQLTETTHCAVIERQYYFCLQHNTFNHYLSGYFSRAWLLVQIALNLLTTKNVPCGSFICPRFEN